MTDKDTGSAARSMGQALAAFHLRLSHWNAVPSVEHLARALRYIRTDYSLCAMGAEDWKSGNYLADVARGTAHHGENLRLLDAVIAALEGTTDDGWKLRLSGRQGRRFTSADFAKELEIAACVMTHIEAGDGYDSAVAMAASEYDCKATKVKDAYSEHSWFVEHLLRLDDKSPVDAIKLLARMSARPRK